MPVTCPPPADDSQHRKRRAWKALPNIPQPGERDYSGNVAPGMTSLSPAGADKPTVDIQPDETGGN